MKKNKQKIIGIDARLYGSIGGGIGRYIKETVDRILVLDNKNKYVVFLYQDSFQEFTINAPNIKKVKVCARWYSFKEQFVLPFLIYREKIDLMHFPHFNVPIFYVTKFVVTIHDLILINFPSKRATKLNPIVYFIKNVFYKIVITRAILKSQEIIAVSKFTKNDVLKHFRVTKDKVKTIYEGVFAQNRSVENHLDNDLKIRYNINEKYFLYVGNVFPHKNIENLIVAFTALQKKHQNISLVLVGRDDYFYRRLKKQINNKNIKILGYLPDNDLFFLYQNALAYVFPSFYEGFGLPPLEAMSSGCPVISSNATCLPEILGDAAIYFNPKDEKEIQQQLENLLNNQDIRNKLIRKGQKQVKRYSWDQSAKETLKIYYFLLNY